MFTQPHRYDAELREIDVVTESLRDLVDSTSLMNTIDLNELANLVVQLISGAIPGDSQRSAVL